MIDWLKAHPNFTGAIERAALAVVTVAAYPVLDYTVEYVTKSHPTGALGVFVVGLVGVLWQAVKVLVPRPRA